MIQTGNHLKFIPFLDFISINMDNELKKLFDEYFYEREGFSLRAERFFDDCDAQDHAVLRKWLEAAFAAGFAASKN